MRAAIVDVGSNTVRLLVADARPGGIERVHAERAYVGLGAEIVRHGTVRPAKLAEVAAIARRFTRRARTAGADRVMVLVTAPGRQTRDPAELVEVLAGASGAPVRALSGEDEGRLAYAGAIARAGRGPELTAVCDIGGGSTELALGRPPHPPSWTRSVELGALRLTEAVGASDPPTPRELAQARLAVGRALATLAPPAPELALVVGGSARALARIVGRTLDEDGLRAALRITTVRRASKLAKIFGLDDERARVLPAAALILAEVVERLGTPLELASAGLREGAVAELLADAAAAA